MLSRQVAFLALAGAAACAPQGNRGQPSDYCAVVAAQDAAGIEMARVLDRFAEAERLQNVGREVEPQYQDAAQTREVVVKTYMGELGAIVTGQTLRRQPDSAPFLERLGVFMESQVAPRWAVRDCSDVPGLDMPRRFN